MSELETIMTAAGTEKTFEMALARTFDAPVSEVWKAWTEKEYIHQWWGPSGFTAPVADMDVREGRSSLVGMRAPDEMGGFEHFHTWTYRRISSEERLEFIQHFADRHGNPIDPASVGMPPGIPKQVPHVLTFVSRPDGATDFTVTEYGYMSPDVVHLSRAGMEECLDKMAALLARNAASD